jgi:hypothetical protein
LADHLIGSAVVVLGSGFEAFESPSPLVEKLIQDLVVTLSRIAKLLGSLGRAKSFAFALKEHGKLQGDFIIFLDGKRSFGAGQRQYTFMDFDHRLSPPGYEMKDYLVDNLIRG